MATLTPDPERRPGDAGPGIDPTTRTPHRVVNRGWYLLLVPPFVGLLWLPFYAKAKPTLWGFPFFYWYQFLWVFIAAGLTALVYVLTTTSDEAPPDPSGGSPADPRAVRR